MRSKTGTETNIDALRIPKVRRRTLGRHGQLTIGQVHSMALAEQLHILAQTATNDLKEHCGITTPDYGGPISKPRTIER